MFVGQGRDTQRGGGSAPLTAFINGRDGAALVRVHVRTDFRSISEPEASHVDHVDGPNQAEDSMGSLQLMEHLATQKVGVNWPGLELPGVGFSWQSIALPLVDSLVSSFHRGDCSACGQIPTAASSSC